MTTTVRSVRVELEMGIAGYVANAKIAGHETEKAFAGAEERISATSLAVSRLEKNMANLAKTSAETKIGQTGLGREVDRTGTSTERASRKTKTYSLEMAIADEKASRLRKSLREQAKASLDAATGIDKTGQSASRAESSIDKYSGRLKTMLGLVALLGPAAARLAAGGLPALTAGFAGLGAAGGGIGVTLLALHGVKDGLKALNDYELERTPENLAKVQQAFAELGPDGAHFVQTLRDLGPEIDHLQDIARAGVLPGFEDSLKSLETRTPIVSQIVNRLSQEVGRLAADAGDALAGDKWTPFFEYVRTTAAPTLDAFARSTGNVALGLANILIAFDPLSRDFTSGLEAMSKRFADWSENLDDDEGFQDFLNTVREAGPELREFLGSTVDLFVGLAKASAPLARTTLPILTGIVKIFAAIANSPVGPALYTAAAGLIVFSRATKLLQGTVGSTTGLVTRLGAETKTTSQKIGLLGARGGVVFAGAAAVGALADSINRIDTEDLDRSLTALGFGNVTDTVDKVIDSLDQLDMTRNKIDFGEIATFGGLLGDSSLDKFANNVDQVDQSLANLVESGHADQAAELFQKIQDLAEAQGVDPADTAKRFDAYSLALQNVADAATHAVTGSGFFARSLGGVASEAEQAARAAQDLSNALAILNGWFDKRDAVLGYKDAIDALTKGLKDGFNRKDLENVNAAGRSILQVADLIKSPTKRAAFLADARERLQELADHAAPDAAAALQKVIDKFDSKGLTHPPPPLKLIADTKPADDAIANTRRDLHNVAVGKTEAKIEADDTPAQRVIRRTHLSLDTLNTTTAKPKVDVDAGNSFSIIGSIKQALGGIHDKTVRVTVLTGNGGKPVAVPGETVADGGTIPGQRHPYGDKVLAHLAPGEEVISNRHGQADRFRADRAAGRIPAYAAGGTVEDRIRGTYTTRYRGSSDTARDPGMAHWSEGAEAAGDAADGAARSLKKLETAADKVQKSLEKQKSKLDDLISQRSSTASSIASTALHDPFGNGLAGLDAQIDADSGDLDAMTKALATLVANGLSPKSALYQQLAEHMDVTTAQQLATLSSTDLASQSKRFDAVQGQAAAFGQGVAGQEFNEAIRDQTKATNELRHTLKDLRQEIHEMGDHVRKGAHDGTKDGAKDVGDQVWSAVKDANDDRRRRTSTSVRTGG